MIISGLACTNGRFSYLERLLSCYLRQDYVNKELLIYNNSPIAISMEPIKGVKLINNHIDLATGKPYQNVGSIFRDALTFLPPYIDYVSIMDDDDIYLPNHFSEAMKHFSSNEHYKVWKPGCYFFKYSGVDIEYREVDNNLEASCIIDFAYLKREGFWMGNAADYNLKWYKKAKSEDLLYVDRQISKPTYCYEIGQSDVLHVSTVPGLDKRRIESTLDEINNYGVGKSLLPWAKEKLDSFFDVYFNLVNYS